MSVSYVVVGKGGCKNVEGTFSSVQNAKRYVSMILLFDPPTWRELSCHRNGRFVKEYDCEYFTIEEHKSDERLERLLVNFTSHFDVKCD